MKPILWITGAGGLIGHTLERLARSHWPEWEIKGLTRSDLDLGKPTAVAAAFHRDHPQVIIHCAALSRSPACDADPALAHQLNVDVTRQLAELASNVRFVFFSTDLVFDGRKGNYQEDDPVNPLGAYALTKVKAEEVVMQHPNALILRTSLNYGTSPTGDRSFNEQLKLVWEQRKPTPLFVDEFRCPIGVEITALATLELTRHSIRGRCHLAGPERLSRWEIGELIASRHSGFAPQLIPGKLADYRGAPRSPDTSLDCSRAQSLLSFRLPRFSDWLREQRPEHS